MGVGVHRPVVRLVSALRGRAARMHIVAAGILDGGAPAPTVEVFTRGRRDWLPDLPTRTRFAAAAGA